MARGAENAGDARARALRFVILLGVVSLFADMTYEGARSSQGPFLLTLGGSAAAVGVVAGLGEVAGYAVRLASGLLADRLRRYWLLTGVGYAVNLLAVPLLALAGSWEVAAALIVAERLGKAVRAPSRDVLLSFAARQVGRGFGFGLHEALDQIGAVAGPLLVAAALLTGEGYRRAFAALAIPALLALAALAAARLLFPAPAAFETPGTTAGAERSGSRPGREFRLYLAFTALSVAGFAHFQLISYHFKARGLLEDPAIPLAFALAMGADALAALAAGRLYDRVGAAVLLALPLGTVPASILAFGGSPAAAWTGAVLWGAVLGVHETVARAAVADLTPPAARGGAYGLFNAAYGAAWFAGSALMGLLYEASAAYVILFSVAAQVLALLAFAALRRAGGRPESLRRSSSRS